MKVILLCMKGKQASPNLYTICTQLYGKLLQIEEKEKKGKEAY